MPTVHLIMRPQDLRANRLLLMCSELAKSHLINIVAVHDTEGESCLLAKDETGWDFPIRELKAPYSSISDPDVSRSICEEAFDTKPSPKDILLISCELFLPLVVHAKKHWDMNTWYDQREMFLHGIGNDLSADRSEALCRLEESCLPSVDFVTTVDSHNGFWVERYLGQGVNAHVLYNAPPLEKDLIDNSRNRVRQRRLNEEVRLVMVGGIRIHQGLEILVEALERLPYQFHLSLIGLVNNHFKRTFEELLEKKHNKRVTVGYGDWMPYNDLVRTISEEHIGLMLKQPSVGQYGLISRGNSRKPLTYMNAGLPCVVPDHKSVCVQIEEEKAGVRVDVQDPQAIADGLSSILEDKDRYLKMCENGLKAIEEKYNFQKAWAKLHAAATRAGLFSQPV